MIVRTKPAMVRGPIGKWIHESGHNDEQGGRPVGNQRVECQSIVTMFKHLNEHGVQLKALEEHPEEGGQEEVVQCDGNQSANQFHSSLIDANQEYGFGHKQTSAEMFVNRVANGIQTSVQMQSWLKLVE